MLLFRATIAITFGIYNLIFRFDKTFCMYSICAFYTFSYWLTNLYAFRTAPAYFFIEEWIDHSYAGFAELGSAEPTFTPLAARENGLLVTGLLGGLGKKCRLINLPSIFAPRPFKCRWSWGLA